MTIEPALSGHHEVTRPRQRQPWSVADLDRLDEGLPGTHLDCATSTYSRILRSLGLDPAILGDDFGYAHAPRPGVWPLHTLKTQRRNHDEAILRWYGISGRMIRHDDPRRAWEYLRLVLADGRLAILCVDLYEWPRSTFHRIRHYPHRVVVAGYRAGEALIVDGRGRRRMIQWMPVDVVDTAMASPGLVSERHNLDGRYLTIDLPRPDPGRPAEPARCYLAKLGDLTSRFLRPASQAGLRGDPGVSEGWPAVQAFMNDLVRHVEGMSELPPDWVVPSITFFGALNAQRLFNALFIETAGRLSRADLSGCAEAFRQVAGAWANLYHGVLYGFHAGRDMPALLGRLIARIDALAGQEKAAIEMLDARVREAASRQQ